ncbi:AcvB/VirJ family lysyl-phosphatidylglycerol hydrolase [Ciceribacter sp. L1K22]|uniref:virulence factor family protein n=1 Tax=Ciceribacter sp. L1K22 TaxID=2820275 RepID=UPI001ABEB366|nr:AcvB/VirJ family lysyl-phosphatidylglycerol hydrolase [Ciceribacter sp. L1K22]MBO3759240.1 virulence factor family protein [Ciceribacter sp. L1K22]
MRTKSGIIALALAIFIVQPALAADNFDTRSLPVDRIVRPDTNPRSVIILLSDAAGWSATEQNVAQAWSGEGAIVVGVDLPTYYRALRAETRACLYLVSDIERLARQLHRAEGMATFTPPVVAGLGEGGTLALAIAAQTPPSTVATTLAVDPGAVVPIEKPLCTPAPKTPRHGGIRYGFTKGALPGAVRVTFTQAATRDGRDHLVDLQATHSDIEVVDSRDQASATLEEAGLRVLSEASHHGTPLDLPLVEVPAVPRHDAFAIIYSGDGGWRDIDQKLGFFLQEDGVPVVGVDALRYFWSEKPPQQVADDLSRIIATYRGRYGASRVVLIGYSFGANILPKAYTLLPDADREAVDLLSLLAPSHQADFEIAVSGWLGVAGAGKHGDPVDHLATVEPAKIQCIYGLAEKESACPALEPRVTAGVQLVSRPGGHHFDGNYRKLADEIMARIRRD